jgi:hypothetical protein
MNLITGFLYTYGYTPSTYSTSYRVIQEQDLKADLPTLQAIVMEQLNKLNISKPIKTAKIKPDKKRKSFILIWSDKNFSVSLRPSTQNHAVAVIKIKHYSWYYRLMRIHKGKGNKASDIFTMASAVIILLILISGVFLGLQSPAFRKLTLYSLSSGIILFVSLIAYVQYV